MTRLLIAILIGLFIAFISLYYSGFLSALGRVIVEVALPAISDDSNNISTRAGFLPVAINISFLFQFN